MTGADFYARETGVLRGLLREALLELQRTAPASDALVSLRRRWYEHEHRLAERDKATDRRSA